MRRLLTLLPLLAVACIGDLTTSALPGDEPGDSSVDVANSSAGDSARTMCSTASDCAIDSLHVTMTDSVQWDSLSWEPPDSLTVPDGWTAKYQVYWRTNQGKEYKHTTTRTTIRRVGHSGGVVRTRFMAAIGDNVRIRIRVFFLAPGETVVSSIDNIGPYRVQTIDSWPPVADDDDDDDETPTVCPVASPDIASDHPDTSGDPIEVIANCQSDSTGPCAPAGVSARMRRNRDDNFASLLGALVQWPLQTGVLEYEVVSNAGGTDTTEFSTEGTWSPPEPNPRWPVSNNGSVRVEHTDKSTIFDQQYRVRGRNAHGWGNWSKAVAPLHSVPLGPFLEAEAASDSSIALTIGEAMGFTGLEDSYIYTLRAATTNNWQGLPNWESLFSCSFETCESTFVHAGLRPNQTVAYSFALSFVNYGKRQTIYSFQRRATTKANNDDDGGGGGTVTREPPSVPQNFQVALSDDSLTATLTWTAPADSGTSAVTGYTIYESDDSVFTATDLDYAHGLTAGQTYSFKVTAQNADGSSEATATISVDSKRAAGGGGSGGGNEPRGGGGSGGGGSGGGSGGGTVTKEPPSEPQDFEVALSDDSLTVTLTWAAPADSGTSAVTGYTIYESDEAVFTTDRLIYAQHLSPGYTYSFKVTAQNADGNGHATATISVDSRSLPDDDGTGGGGGGGGGGTTPKPCPKSPSK